MYCQWRFRLSKRCVAVIHRRLYPYTCATSWKTHPFLSFAKPRNQKLGMSYPAASQLAELATSQVCNRSIPYFVALFPPPCSFQCGVRGAVGRVSIRPRLGGSGCSLPTFSRRCFKITVQEVKKESPPFLDLPQRVPAAATKIPHKSGGKEPGSVVWILKKWSIARFINVSNNTTTKTHAGRKLYILI